MLCIIPDKSEKKVTVKYEKNKNAKGNFINPNLFKLLQFTGSVFTCLIFAITLRLGNNLYIHDILYKPLVT